MRDYCGGYARTTVTRTSCCAGCATRRVYDVWQRLTALGLGEAGADEVTDVVSCPGTDSCKLGITSSMGLNRAIQERLEEMDIDDPLTKRIHIKMSGCPNGCGQHHIGNIGFYGASIKVGDKTIPAYVAHVGGRYDGGEVALRHAPEGPPARQARARRDRALDPLLRGRARATARRSTPSSSASGRRSFEAKAKDLSLPVEFDLENIDQFIDWSRHEPYQVIRGEGECAV